MFGHVSRLEQVLINLINNARDSLGETPSDGGQRRIAISAGALRRDGNEYLSIVVADNGPGIAEQVLKRLPRERRC